jgi:hypothetical protein
MTKAHATSKVILFEAAQSFHLFSCLPDVTSMISSLVQCQRVNPNLPAEMHEGKSSLRAAQPTTSAISLVLGLGWYIAKDPHNCVTGDSMR